MDKKELAIWRLSDSVGKADFRHWLDASPEHAISYERLRRWHLVQEELAAQAKAADRPFVVTDDGLE